MEVREHPSSILHADCIRAVRLPCNNFGGLQGGVSIRSACQWPGSSSCSAYQGQGQGQEQEGRLLCCSHLHELRQAELRVWVRF